jgi:2-hydroxy-6-oxonona-2,4-dienedioate hydrolase
MRFGAPLALSSALALAGGLTAYERYRRDMKRIIAEVEHGASIADTPAGLIEFAEAGNGEPLLMIHGAGGGYDQGLLIGRDFEGLRIIAPSRFGYLGMSVPKDASPSAQADVHAALLDHLGIDRCVVVGVSAGGPSAIEFALRYPDRTSALILLVPRTYDPTNAIGVDEQLPSQMILRLVESSSDFLFWLAIKLARPAIVRFLGVPPELEAHAPEAERARVTEVMRSILPLSRRVAGIIAEGYGPVGPWPLEQIRVPTLVVSAEDDLFDTLPGARFTAEHIPGAELKVLESGGHLMLGQTERVQSWVRDFLGRTRAAVRDSRSDQPIAA